MSTATRPAAADSAPPVRGRITGGLAALACAACCAVPLFVAAGIVTGASGAVLEKTLLAVAAGLAVTALGMWWLHRDRTARRAARGSSQPGCGCGNCAAPG